MAQTTTPVYKTQCILSIDNASGTMTDISGTNSKVTIAISKDIAEYFTHTGDYSLSNPGKSKIAITTESAYSTTATEALGILRAWQFDSPTTARSIQIDVPDSTTGSHRYYGEVHLTNVTIVDSDASDPNVMPVTAEFVNNGAFSFTVIA